MPLFLFIFLAAHRTYLLPFFALAGSSASYTEKTEMSHPRVISMRNLDISIEDSNAWDRNNTTVSKGLTHCGPTTFDLCIGVR